MGKLTKVTYFIKNLLIGALNTYGILYTSDNLDND